MFELNQKVGLSEYTAARNWAVERGFTMSGVGNGRYRIVSAEKPSEEEKAKYLRTERNALLASSDWTQLPDSPLTPEQKQAWAEYRQLLRDIPRCEGFPNVALPVFSEE